jgi:hypothetical protein
LHQDFVAVVTQMHLIVSLFWTMGLGQEIQEIIYTGYVQKIPDIKVHKHILDIIVQ